ncbi:hypothetical protein [Providencia sp. PROV038]|uniref:hypothetical protein n=1 Tax=Providencia sp. PROV038 TaxID=2949769 RepID=UPI00234B3954|nr:hypothetical protein [Providencia sp. PROV038]
MNYPQNRHSNKSSKKMISDHDDLLNSNKRELIYYIHYLQKNRKWRGYISDLNYNNIKDVIKQLENAISKVIRQEGDINDFTERMLKEYHENSIRESEFEWLRNDERACFWLLFVILNNRGNSQDLSAIEKNNILNLQSGSLYYSIIAWFDKFTNSRSPRGGRGDNEKKLKACHQIWLGSERNPVSNWLLSMTSSDEIDYCYNYLERLGISIIDVVINDKDANFFLRLGERYNLSRKSILVAFFDYLFLSSRNGIFAAENLKMKMASGLSSWKNRKNKEGYVDVHFDIKKENISKLEALKKRFNLMSKKEVVNALIEREYDKKE